MPPITDTYNDDLLVDACYVDMPAERAQDDAVLKHRTVPDVGGQKYIGSFLRSSRTARRVGENE